MMIGEEGEHGKHVAILGIGLKRGEVNMAFLLAKIWDEPGCLAVEVERGSELAELVSRLGRKTLSRGIQILTVSDTKAWGEYEPYHMLGTEQEFIKGVFDMMDEIDKRKTGTDAYAGMSEGERWAAKSNETPVVEAVAENLNKTNPGISGRETIQGGGW